MGRTILITGANGGLGQALVAKLAAKGHFVIATDISSPEAAHLPKAWPPVRAVGCH